MAELRSIRTDRAPQAIGPYSQAIVAGNLVFTAGQVPFDPATGQVVEGDIAVQTDRVLENIRQRQSSPGSADSMTGWVDS